MLASKASWPHLHSLEWTLAKGCISPAETPEAPPAIPLASKSVIVIGPKSARRASRVHAVGNASKTRP